MDNLEERVLTYFPDASFRSMREGIYVSTPDCLTMTVVDAPPQLVLAVDSILSNTNANCQTNGTVILNQLKKLADDLGALVVLDDASVRAIYVETGRGGAGGAGAVKRADFALSVFEIMRTGQSWYNRHGFFSETSEAERRRNEKLRETTLGELGMKARGQVKADAESAVKHLEAWLGWERDRVLAMTLREAFERLYAEMRGTSAEKPLGHLAYLALSDLVDVCGMIMLYNSELSYQGRRRGGRRRTRRTRRRFKTV